MQYLGGFRRLPNSRDCTAARRVNRPGRARIGTCRFVRSASLEVLESRLCLSGQLGLGDLASATFDNHPPVVAEPIADVAVEEDASDTIINLSDIFDDEDLGQGDWLTYTSAVSTPLWAVAGEVSQDSYTSIHQELLYTHDGDDRDLNGPEHDLARENVLAWFEDLGLAASLDPFLYNDETYYNVVGIKPGLTRPNDIYVVGAHYDSINRHGAVLNAPGADDNASGTAAVLEAARVLSQYEFDCTLVFLAFDREEQGLKGSYAYVAEHTDDNILGMVNLDMIAYNPDGPNKNKVRLYDYVDEPGDQIKADLLDAFALYSGTVTAHDMDQNGQSDHRPFELEGFDAAMIIEYEVWNNPNYHRATDSVDTPDYIDYAFATDITTAATGYLATAADLIGTPVLTANVIGNQLVLDYADDENGTVEIVVRATDSQGAWVEDTFLVSVDSVADVAGRHVFYNDSAFDAGSLDPDANNDLAIAPDKQALLPGGTASFENYTSYHRGINGIMVDVADAESPITADDFSFRVGNSSDLNTWTPAPEPATVTVRPRASTDGSDRVTIIWDYYAILNQWLEVTVAGESLGLAGEDVFYFGNAVAEAGNLTTDAQITTTDLLLARNNPRNFTDPATLECPYDYDRDDRVNATDVLLARNNVTNFLNRLELIDLVEGEGVASAMEPSDVDLASYRQAVAFELAGSQTSRDKTTEQKHAVDLAFMLES